MKIIHGDNLDVMAGMDADSIDLIITSPPYAANRKHDYVSWFIPRALQMRRILKPTGSLVINIKENARGGQRSCLPVKRPAWFCYVV